MFALDLGSDGASGPYLAWSAKGTQDGQVDPRNFYIREGSNKEMVDVTKGMVLDIEGMKTGWQHSEGVAGVAPEWKWNSSLSHMMPCPGERQDWKQGFSIPVALGGGRTATWEQAGAGVWQALLGLQVPLQGQPARGMLPLVKLIGTEVVNFKRGNTIKPVLEIAKWVERPDSLKEGAAAGIATEPAPQPAAAPQPAPAPAPAASDDDLEF